MPKESKRGCSWRILLTGFLVATELTGAYAVYEGWRRNDRDLVINGSLAMGAATLGLIALWSRGGRGRGGGRPRSRKPRMGDEGAETAGVPDVRAPSADDIAREERE